MKLSEIKELAENADERDVNKLSEATLKLCGLVEWVLYDEDDYRTVQDKAKELGLEIE